ncbi:Diphthamide biosynthesis 3 [Hyphodiscus hymeniophilus]|uniref:Diphthamide biosynthesis protein 3 n=1 Tax=Hyphodiscus hymeniophilus TaxID=353542 RepID=A0A9P7AUB6_9HELO|nr:Diphthamide biosynthesis 3 [Hyphodiscus hymeniophilus]
MTVTFAHNISGNVRLASEPPGEADFQKFDSKEPSPGNNLQSSDKALQLFETPPRMAENIYDEIEIEDMTYDKTLEIYHYPCPCGDRFEIGIADLRDGEDVADDLPKPDVEEREEQTAQVFVAT